MVLLQRTGFAVAKKRSQRSSKHASAPALLVLSCLLPQCRDKVAEKPSEPPPAAKASASAERLTKLPPGEPGEWIESQRYRLRVLGVWPCDEPLPDDPDSGAPRTSDAGAGADASAVAASSPEGKSGKFRLGVTVEIEATEKINVTAIVASPKAATLEKDGKVFRALMKPSPTPACQNLLGLERLAPEQSTQGVLVFEAPNESYLRSSVFAFKPPRWGGEFAAEVEMPDCFGLDCPETPAPRSKSKPDSKPDAVKADPKPAPAKATRKPE